MNSKNVNVTNKKAGNGNGNSVINNYEHSRNTTSNSISNATPSTSGANAELLKKQNSRSN
ncbi:hypothetical protein lbkm_0848 [Lachnospiraceae bacterium KM106-2]|nr:hypothetical protein lbkm_0848 [Lachnospiraceae bacterium KM106-2]